MKKIILLVVVASILSCSKDQSNTPNPTNPASLVFLNAAQIQTTIEKNIAFELTGNIPFDVANINWDFGDGTIFYGNSSNKNVYHQFQNIGSYTVKAKILRQNGEQIELSKVIQVVNSNVVKVNKITILNYPNKFCYDYQLCCGGLSVVQYNFSGKWDEDEVEGTTDVNRFSDTYLNIYKVYDKPDNTNPSNIVADNVLLLNTTGININQGSSVFDVSSQNIKLSLNAIKNFKVEVMDYDLGYSINENGTTDDAVGELMVLPSSFSSNSFTYTESGVQIKIDYQVVN